MFLYFLLCAPGFVADYAAGLGVLMSEAGA